MKLRRASIIIATLLLLLLIPASAGAKSVWEDSVDYQITLLKDGSARFEETRTVQFDGDYTRYGRYYNFPEYQSFANWSVRVDGVPWKQMDAPDNDNRPDGYFAVENTDEGATLTIYHDSEDVERTFTIGYRVRNAVTRYDDVAEFFWNLTGGEELSTIALLTADVTIPRGASEEEFRVWAHGPLEGEIVKESASRASLSVDYVPLYTLVDIRLVMPAGLFLGGHAAAGDALQGILEEERALAEDANARREEAEAWAREWEEEQARWREEHPIQYALQSLYYAYEGTAWHTVAIMLLTVGFLPYIMLYVVLRRKRVLRRFPRNRPAQSPEYYRTLPEDAPPALVNALYAFYDSGRQDRGDQFTATLLNLSLQGLLRMRGAGDETELILRENAAPVHAHEAVLLEMIRVAKDDAPGITLEELQRYIKKHPEWAVDQRNAFHRAVDTEFGERYASQRVQEKPGYVFLMQAAIALALAALLCVPIGIFLFYSIGMGFGVLAVWSLGTVIVNWRMNTQRILDQKGEDMLALWEGFARFLDAFTTFDEKELPEFPVWRKYLVYGVALGEGERLAKQLALRYPQQTLEEDGSYFACLYYGGRFHDDFFRSVDTVQRNTYSASKPSDSSGGGGGFSSSGGGSSSGSGGGFAD